MTDDEKKRLLRLILDFADRKYREGSADGLGDRPLSKQRRDEAEKLLAKIREAMK